MTTSRISLDYEDLEWLCQRNSVRRLSLFGSVLEGTARPDIDIDLLVEFKLDARPSLLDMARIEGEPSALLGGCKVDLRTVPELSPHFRDEVVRMASQDVLFDAEWRTLGHQAQIVEAMVCLTQAAPEGSSVILFGSHARGDARADSDLDLLVIEPDVHDVAAETVRLSSLLVSRRIPADVVVMTRSAFERQREVPNTLAYRVAQEGGVHDLIRSHT